MKKLKEIPKESRILYLIAVCIVTYQMYENGIKHKESVLLLMMLYLIVAISYIIIKYAKAKEITTFVKKEQEVENDKIATLMIAEKIIAGQTSKTFISDNMERLKEITGYTEVEIYTIYGELMVQSGKYMKIAGKKVGF